MTDSGIDAVARFLDEQGVSCEVVEHRQTYTAASEGRAAGVPPDHVAKTVILHDDGGYRMAVLPASDRLDVRRLRDLLEDAGHLRLATEEEMRSDFAMFEVGAVPPFGPMLQAPEIMDRRLLEHDRILCSGGAHRHSLLVDPKEIVRVAQPQIADICEK